MLPQKRPAPDAIEPSVDAIRDAFGKVAFGCWQLGNKASTGDYWGTEYTDDQAIKMVKMAVDAGVTLFDTAQDYAKGDSEIQLGVALKALSPEDRSKVFVASKIPPNDCNQVETKLRATLGRLQLESIDLYQVHWPIDANAMAHFAGGHARFGDSGRVDEATVPSVRGAFEQLMHCQKQGLIKHIGVSNFGVAQLQEALATGAKIVSNQLCYNLIWRAAEFEILNFCLKHQIAVIVYSPLMQGILAGHYKTADDVPPMRARSRHFRGTRPNSRHGEDGQEEILMRTLNQIQSAVKEEPEYQGKTLSMFDVALAWPLQHPAVATVIAGMTKDHHIESNVRAANIVLRPELMAKLEAATLELKEALGSNADLWQGGSNGRIK